MGGFVDGLQLADGDMGVNLGVFEFGVPEHGLDETDIDAVLQHEGDAGMTPFARSVVTIPAPVTPFGVNGAIGNGLRHRIFQIVLRQSQLPIVRIAVFANLAVRAIPVKQRTLPELPHLAVAAVKEVVKLGDFGRFPIKNIARYGLG